MTIAVSMHALLSTLFPICRSITGNGVRETLRILAEVVPQLRMSEVDSGAPAFDWTVPKEWRIDEAYLLAPDGRRVLDFSENNLHVVGYSTPVDTTMRLEDLQAHLHSLPELPDAVPYITSYYRERWGFCLSHRQRERLEPGVYRAVIKSELVDGSLTYGEVVIPGQTADEILLSTNVCHPSMANNELSGPVVAAFLARWVAELPTRRFTYRFVFVPETIGAIVYLHRHLEHLKANVKAGFVCVCVGDDRAYSYLPSRQGDTLADRVASHVLRWSQPTFRRYSFLDRGSDERQYCSPGVDLPVCSIMRTKYGEYPEYHTSLDDLTLVTPSGLQGAYDVYRQCLTLLEHNETLRMTVPCEPQLGKRGLYPTLSTRSSAADVAKIGNLVAYADGTRDLVALADAIEQPAWELLDLVARLKHNGLLEVVPAT